MCKTGLVMICRLARHLPMVAAPDRAARKAQAALKAQVRKVQVARKVQARRGRDHKVRDHKAPLAHRHRILKIPMLCLRGFSRVPPVAPIPQGHDRVEALILRLTPSKARRAIRLKVRAGSAHRLIHRDLHTTNRAKRALMLREASGGALVGPILLRTCVRDRVGPVSQLRASILGLPTRRRVVSQSVSRPASLLRKAHKAHKARKGSREGKISRDLRVVFAAMDPTL